jgi:hypothetical protein
MLRRSGLTILEYQRHPYYGAAFQMARLVRTLGISLVNSG